jgi:hypothetical protein
MSDHGNDGASDSVNFGKVILVGVVSLVIFAASIAWAAAIWHDSMAKAEARAGKARLFDTKRTEIGIVDQVPFNSDKRLPKWRHDRKVELESYGWVDKAKGVVHMPIETAMEKVAGGSMPVGAPP